MTELTKKIEDTAPRRQRHTAIKHHLIIQDLLRCIQEKNVYLHYEIEKVLKDLGKPEVEDLIEILLINLDISNTKQR